MITNYNLLDDNEVYYVVNNQDVFLSYTDAENYLAEIYIGLNDNFYDYCEEYIEEWTGKEIKEKL